MTIERGQYGQYIISSFVNGYLITKQYYDYSRKDAVASYRQYRKELQAQGEA